MTEEEIDQLRDLEIHPGTVLNEDIAIRLKKKGLVELLPVPGRSHTRQFVITDKGQEALDEWDSTH
jgi:DNA-binding PadR family transcriptional regulator